MTYCLAIAVDEGLVFASDSRTSAGADQVATYGKMHAFGVDGQRQIALLSAGNLATSQAVVARVNRDVAAQAELHMMNAPDLEVAAEYLGRIIRAQEEKHGDAVARAGFSAEATFILGGQVRSQPPRIFLVYPQGNFITTSPQTPFLQVGETKYGKAILDRIVEPSTGLEDAACCALVSIDSTMRSNATVGPPIEILAYRRDALVLEHYRCLREDDPYLLEIKRLWNEKLTEVFNALPRVVWDRVPDRPRFG